MNDKNDLTKGSVGKKLVFFALPYLLAAFMQTFYGLADLYVVGLYNDPSTTTAVSIGSQVMHMLTVVILGFAMGTTVHIGRCVGAKEEKKAAKVVGNSIGLFTMMALGLTLILLLASGAITSIMLTPKEAVSQTVTYLRICSLGIPFIVAYNVIASIFRGAGDSTRPLIFVTIACITNVVLDFVFVGSLGMGAAGAALATILGQAVSVLCSLLIVTKINLGFKVTREDLNLDKTVVGKILNVGTPIALQDGFIQVAFVVITIIANSRGLTAAAAVGIVEKLICFLFLVPSSFLSAISAITAQNIGAKKPERAKQSLYVGLAITVAWGLFWAIYSQFLPGTLVGLFSKEAEVVNAGCAYLRSYGCDICFAAIHFCFSGYFCGIEKSGLSFVHNLISVLALRIPGTYLTSKWWPNTLYPMGWAAPIGSLFSDIFCLICFIYITRKAMKEY